MEKTIIYTDGGSVKKDDCDYGGWGMYIKRGDWDQTRWQGMPEGTTNNRGEMSAIIRAMQLILENNWMEVAIFSDSEITVNGINRYYPNWVRNNWIKSDGNPVKNKDLWLVLVDHIKKLKRKKVTWSISWVKAHNGEDGNERADAAARKANTLSLAGNYEEFIEGENAEADAPKKKTKKQKPKPYNPLICGNYLIDVVNRRDNAEGHVYYTTSFSKETASAEDKKEGNVIRHRFLGVADANRFEGVIVSKEPEDIVEKLHQHQQSLVRSDYAIPVLYNWRKIRSTKTWEALHEVGLGCVSPNKKGELEFWEGREEISFLALTTRMAWFAIDSLDVKYNLLSRYISGDTKGLDFHDVTDLFVDTNDKGKKEIKKELQKQKRVDLKIKEGNETLIIPMVQDTSIIDRNHLARLLKQDKDLVMKVVIHDRTQTTLRWSLIVESPSGIACYNNPSTNIILIP